MRLGRIAAASLAGLALLSAPAAGQHRGTVIYRQTGPAGQPGQVIQVYKRSYALVIGIDKYTDPAWPRLRNAVADAREVARALDRHGFDVTLKTDVTRAELDEALRDFLFRSDVDRDTRLVIWFAGHGHTLRAHAQDDGFLIPRDAVSPANEGEFRKSALGMDQFNSYFRPTKAKHALAIFDSCFSGLALDRSKASDLAAPPNIALTVR